jgi:RIO kinase 1
MTKRTNYGRAIAAGQWAASEFDALARLWALGAPVPYPVQLLGTELMLEFIGGPDGVAAPRLAQCRPAADELASLFTQCVDAMRLLARAGFAHGDLSPYNLLVDTHSPVGQATPGGRLVLIDLPQIVDVVANPRGAGYLERDCVNVCRWFSSRGLDTPDLDHLFGDLMAEAVAAF